MANELTTFKFDPKLPAFLQQPAFAQLGQAAVAGLGNTEFSARLSFRGGRWHLIDKEGKETDSPENNGVAIDLVVIGANEKVSKMFYAEAYSPDKDTQPACFSDNGTAPSERAAKPQSMTCALCPKNVWGSAVNPTSGKQSKACSDSKKLAVVRAADLMDELAHPGDANFESTIYSLSIPAASLKGWAAVCNTIAEKGAPIGAIVFSFTFDTSASFPLLKASPKRWIEQNEADLVRELAMDDEVLLAVGSKDKAMTPDAFSKRVAPQPETAAAPSAPAAQTPAAPAPVMPARDGPVPVQPPAGVQLPAHTQEALAPRRGRPRGSKAQTGPAPSEPPAPQPGDPGPMPDFLDRSKPAVVSPSAIPAASAEQDNALARAMGLKV